MMNYLEFFKQQQIQTPVTVENLKSAMLRFNLDFKAVCINIRQLLLDYKIIDNSVFVKFLLQYKHLQVEFWNLKYCCVAKLLTIILNKHDEKLEYINYLISKE